MDTILQICNQILLFGGIIFMVMGAIMYVFPPKKINGLYGYRSGSSMQNQQKWDFAQTYSAKIMMFTGLAFLVLAPIKGLFKTNEATDVLLGIIISILGCLAMIVIVEKALRKLS